MDYLDLDFKVKDFSKIVFLILISLFSCTSSFTVVLKEDSSAIVESELPIGDMETEKFTKSNLITILDTTNYRLKFKIKTVDSLGNYLQGFPSGAVEFKTNKDTLTINSGDAVNFRENNAHKSHLNIKIQSKNRINLIQFDKKFTSKINKSSIRITKTPKQLKKQEKKLITKITIGIKN